MRRSSRPDPDDRLPHAVGVFVFGQAHLLRDAFSTGIPGLDPATNTAIALVANGPTRHAGEYHKRFVHDRTRAQNRATADWDERLQQNADHGFEISSAEERFIGRHGIRREQLPCIAVFVAGLQTPLTIISLPPITWANDVGLSQLFRRLENRLHADRLLDEVRRSGGGVGLRAFFDALQSDISALEGPPSDVISMSVAINRFRVSRATLTAAVKSGRLNSYRAPNAPKNAQHRFSEADIASNFPRLRPL